MTDDPNERPPDTDDEQEHDLDSPQERLLNDDERSGTREAFDDSGYDSVDDAARQHEAEDQ
jgi:hypothetical protein